MDILILMLVSVFLGIRLWNVLGKEYKKPRKPSSKVIHLRQSEVKVEKETPSQNAFYAGFDEENFLSGAEKAFLLTLNAYFQGQKEKLEKLLSPSLLKQFLSRKPPDPAPEIQMLSFHIQDKEIKQGLARVKVHFITKQIQGNTAEEVEDTWVFERNISATTPNWVVVEMN